ncbi:Sporulation initiation phosphotransferase F [Rubripirellula tenax]|uniref:Sporulation initiation phosphotransferase F n=1 Tax=Rubripirellula tenax TaxID=2528015 RepID=A0A5C6ECG3_9BACT|nr:response regulator [Rubripirellula tenax]TWU46134.1 Sporulation initiation phosphotransferase F [Rubripirellula tenax]
MTGKRVLIVDDDHDICVNLKDILDDLGYVADTACDSTSALRLVSAGTYDVALLDYHIPGMNGVDLHQEIVKNLPQIASIMMTAYAHDFGCEHAKDGGIRQVLRKPVDIVELLSLVKKFSN